MMGKKLFLMITAAVISLLLVSIPTVWIKAIPEYKFCMPSQTTLTEQVKVRGRVETGRADYVRSGLPLIAEKIEVSVGSSVKKGQILCRIDKNSTLSAYRLFLSEAGIDPNQTSLEELVTKMQSLPDEMKTLINNLTDTMDQSLLIDLMCEKLERILESVTLVLPETLLAPCDGIITQIGLYYTALSTPGGILFTVGDPNTPMALLSVPESEIQKIQIGQSVRLKGDGFSGTRTAVITEISSAAGEASSLLSDSSSFLVYADFEGTPPPIGCSFTANITVSPSRAALILPYEAVLQNKASEYVRLVKGNIIEEVAVQTGAETANGIEICSGIDADCIVLFGEEPLSRFWKLKANEKETE